MEAQYGKLLDMIRSVRINVPLVDVLAGMPNYGKFLKELFHQNLETLEVFSFHVTSTKLFSIDVIDEILEQYFDALLDEGSEILHSIEGTILEEKLFAEFDKFTTMTTDEKSEFESDTEEPQFEKITFNTDYKIKTSLEEPLTDLELKPLPDNLVYAFLEEPSFLPVIISSQLSEQNKNKLIYVLKRHKQAFAWKTTYIPRICPSFCECLLVYVMLQLLSKDAHLVLNWEKCHFMVKEGIVLGHKVSEEGLKVDKANIDVISKLPPHTNIKEDVNPFGGGNPLLTKETESEPIIWDIGDEEEYPFVNEYLNLKKEPIMFVEDESCPVYDTDNEKEESMPVYDN
ncbi:hypothetical protein Tco_0791383 [Tanacetum coccineum]